MEKINIKNTTSKYEKRIFSVLKKQNFLIGNIEKKIIKEFSENGRRYFFMVGKRVEGGNTITRFIKIPQNNNKKLLDPFKRQIEFAKYVKDKNLINTRTIVDYNYDTKKGLPYLIMDTLPTDNVKVGFILKNKGTDLLGEKEAKSVIDQIEKFHAINPKQVPPKLHRIFKKYPGNYNSLKREIILNLNKKVKPLDFEFKTPFHLVIEKRLKIKDFKQKIKELLDSFDNIIDNKENNIESMLHGDMAPNNIYVFDSSDVELLDLEWVGITKNKAISMIIDYGNFRERAWVNKKFQESLDRILLSHYKLKNKERLGLTIIKLSIIRSSLHLSKYFENYEEQKQKLSLEIRRKKSTEGDLLYALSL